MLKPIFHNCLLSTIPICCGDSRQDATKDKHLTITDLLVFSNILNYSVTLDGQGFDNERHLQTDYLREQCQENKGFISYYQESQADVARCLEMDIRNVYRSVSNLREYGLIKGDTIRLPKGYWKDKGYIKLFPRYYNGEERISPDFQIIIAWYYHKACQFNPDGDNAEIFMTGSKISEQLPINPRTRQRAVRWMIDKGICAKKNARLNVDIRRIEFAFETKRPF